MNDLHWFCQNDFSEALFGRVVAETCFQSGTVNHQLLRRSDKASEICVRVIHEPHRGMRKDMLKALHLRSCIHSGGELNVTVSSWIVNPPFVVPGRVPG